MPIKIPANLPATEILNSENIFVMDEMKALYQDIRPLRIIIMNLMPEKIQTETQILRLIGNSPLQVEVTLLHPKTYLSKHTPVSHLKTFYKTFDEISREKFDGLIITGAPVENMEFEDVNYWRELTEVMKWSRKNVFSTYHICWGAQAGLYYHYGIKKYNLDKKMFGVFLHKKTRNNVKLLRGFDDAFYVPHSRYTTVRKEDIERFDELEILSESDESGVYIVASKDGRQIFVTGHSEYDGDRLATEYFRDIDKGLPIEVPQNYFEDNDPGKNPVVKWRAHGNLLYVNWLNYYVYQETPYDLGKLKSEEYPEILY